MTGNTVSSHYVLSDHIFQAFLLIHLPRPKKQVAITLPDTLIAHTAGISVRRVSAMWKNLNVPKYSARLALEEAGEFVTINA